MTVAGHVHAATTSYGIFTVAIAPVGRDSRVGASILWLENRFDDDLDGDFLVIVMNRARVIVRGGFEDVDIAGRRSSGARSRHDMSGVIFFGGVGFDLNWGTGRLLRWFLHWRFGSRRRRCSLRRGNRDWGFGG